MEQAATAAGLQTGLKVKKKKNQYRKYSPLLIMMVPGLLYLLFNNYLPMMGIAIAFKKVNFAKGFLKSEWIGFDNFEYLFKTSDAFIITRNTILYNVFFIALGTILALACAILLNEIKNKMLSKFYQSVITLPHLISMVIVSYLVFALMSAETGFMNKTVLPWFGIEEGISWYSEEKYWPVILTVVHFWKGVGYSSIVFFAALLGIDEEYYEAAKLDGASRLQQIRHITLPILSPVIIMLTLLSVGRIFYSDFGLFYQVPMNAGALFNTTATIDTYVFRGLMGSGDIGMSTAAGVYQSIVGFLLVMFANFMVRLYNKENALF
ncbi:MULTISPECIES: sugar ABC transporter permease [unclassified Paenibacillus]|uniref:ABC transporter permease n=1 Tax=unclassified Paenibacillus TaxID=185978 RepID=UPI00277E0CFB|nr:MULTISPECIES: ABC transporter permease subunit [unclassified Paenibacillus]MDQ0897719.1 putative aldouronate transport system permease protein [Paenibacillus sp. V4I7]MDQ0916288.1 putative aldouronate transport system permease protein [Paenibacillus sp. V4I5]